MEAIENEVSDLIKAVQELHVSGGIDASKAIQTLKESGFEDASVQFVQAIYYQLSKSQIDMNKLIQVVIRLHRWRLVFSQRALEELEYEGFNNVTVEFVEAIFNQLEKAAEKHIKTSRENGEKAYYYSLAPGEIRSEMPHVWSERYVLLHKVASSKAYFHQFELFDLYNDKSVPILVQKRAAFFKSIYPLMGDFGLLVERGEVMPENTAYFISLIAFDFYDVTCKKFETIEYHSSGLKILVNKFDPSKFILLLRINGEISARICNVVKKEIVVGDQIALPFEFDSYFDGSLYVFHWTSTLTGLLTSCTIFVYNLERKTTESINLTLPKNYCAINTALRAIEWVGNKVFVWLRSAHSDSVLAYFDTQTCEWTTLEFVLKLDDEQDVVFYGNSLIISIYQFKQYTKGLFKLVYNFYKIPIQKPDLLQNMAWLILIKKMEKRRKLKGAYESARRYLPYNSFIRCPFVQPEPDEKS